MRLSTTAAPPRACAGAATYVEAPASSGGAGWGHASSLPVIHRSALCVCVSESGLDPGLDPGGFCTNAIILRRMGGQLGGSSQRRHRYCSSPPPETAILCCRRVELPGCSALHLRAKFGPLSLRHLAAAGGARETLGWAPHLGATRRFGQIEAGGGQFIPSRLPWPGFARDSSSPAWCVETSVWLGAFGHPLLSHSERRKGQQHAREGWSARRSNSDEGTRKHVSCHRVEPSWSPIRCGFHPNLQS